jgi:protein-tyrosine phosphatase
LSNYIDLHNHILPAIDDGPRTMNEAVLQARALVAAGYGTVVATPHSFEGRPSPALIHERLAELQEELGRLEIPLKVLPGAEQHIEPQTLQRLQQGEILTLNNSRYLLLELPMLQPLPPYTEQLIFDLVVHGYRPVIPHPERTLDLQKNPQLLLRLWHAGALFQVTWGALTGQLGPECAGTANLMIDHNLAHLFSTDAHNAASRLLTVNKAAAFLDQKTGPGSASLMLRDRPLQLISNQDFLLPPASQPLKDGMLSTKDNLFTRLFSLFR